MHQPPFDIDVQTAFLPEQSAPERHIFAFSYTITITNIGPVRAQLIARHWMIEDGEGAHEEVRGLGVVGEQPMLQPGEHFQYTSGCRLRTEAGSMHGSYRFVSEEGEPFDVPIARFVLDATHGSAARTLH